MVRRRARTRAALGPTAGDLVLLADAGLVGEPDLYGGGLDALLLPDLVQARGKALPKILDRALSLLVMTRTSREAYDIPWRAIPGSMSAWRRRRGIPRRSIGRGRRSASARRHARPGSGRSRVSLRRARLGARRFRRDGCPGGLQSISPSGPWALNFITQSRTIWSVTPL